MIHRPSVVDLSEPTGEGRPYKEEMLWTTFLSGGFRGLWQHQAESVLQSRFDNYVVILDSSLVGGTS